MSKQTALAKSNKLPRVVLTPEAHRVARIRAAAMDKTLTEWISDLILSVDGSVDRALRKARGKR